ncbi:MAG TPA: chloride channel protein [Rectinemataceae bacterium]|nr:chloride channel protein [Rectinemataceae bacterium]
MPQSKDLRTRIVRIFSSLLTSFLGLPETTRTVLITALLSIVAASVAIAFLALTNGIFALTFLNFAKLPLPFFLLATFLTIGGTSLASGLLLTKISPEAAGSGIPQLKAAYWTEMGYVPLKPIIIKFIAGVLAIGGGSSLGREGPTVYMGGGLASWLSAYTGSSKRNRRGPALIGASAGLAAAFNTPLASITFVLEEIVGDLSSRSIGRVVLSSVIGAFAVYAVIGRHPAFDVAAIDNVTWVHYAIAPVVALAAAFLGFLFQKYTLALRLKAKGQTRYPAWLMPFFGALVTWALAVSVFAATGKLGVFGLGYIDLESVLKNNFIWWVAGILVFAKLAATIFSYGLGGSGGIFSPLLFIGGMAGYFIGGLVSLFLPLSPSDRIVLSAVGMSTCLGTVLKAPLSSLLIVFEMTHQFAMVPALLIGMFVSMAVSSLTGKENFYDGILVQDGHELHKVRPPLDLDGWRNLELSAIANKAPVLATTLNTVKLKELFGKYRFDRFPLVIDGRLEGIIDRAEVQRALARGEPLKPEDAVVCNPKRAIRDASNLFIQSKSGVIVLVNDESQVVGIVTLHDILRAQAANEI